MENKLTMRKFKITDTFKMSKILKKMGLKFDAEGKTQQQLGTEMFVTFLENMHMAEEEFVEFFSDLLGMETKEFEDLGFEKLAEIMDLFKEQDGFKVFSQLLFK